MICLQNEGWENRAVAPQMIKQEKQYRHFKVRFEVDFQTSLVICLRLTESIKRDYLFKKQFENSKRSFGGNSYGDFLILLFVIFSFFYSF